MESYLDWLKTNAPYLVMGTVILALVGWFVYTTFGNQDYKRKGWDYLKNIIIAVAAMVILGKLFPAFGTTLTEFMKDPCTIVGASCK